MHIIILHFQSLVIKIKKINTFLTTQLFTNISHFYEIKTSNA